jgi:hypothetical protein
MAKRPRKVLGVSSDPLEYGDYEYFLASFTDLIC